MEWKETASILIESGLVLFQQKSKVSQELK